MLYLVLSSVHPLFISDNLFMAEKILRDTVQSNPLDADSWRLLGDVLSAKDHGSGEECLLTAIALNQSTPLLSFSSFPRVVDIV